MALMFLAGCAGGTCQKISYDTTRNILVVQGDQRTDISTPPGEAAVEIDLQKVTDALEAWREHATTQP